MDITHCVWSGSLMSNVFGTKCTLVYVHDTPGSDMLRIQILKTQESRRSEVDDFAIAACSWSLKSFDWKTVISSLSPLCHLAGCISLRTLLPSYESPISLSLESGFTPAVCLYGYLPTQVMHRSI